MKRIAALVMMAPSLWAGAAPAQNDDEAGKRAELAVRVIERTWPDTRRAIEAMRDQVATMLPIEQRDDFRQLLDQNFDFERLKQLNAAMMARHFTVAELDALERFYASPEGQSVMHKMPLLMSELTPFTQQLMLEAIKRVPREKRPPQLREL